MSQKTAIQPIRQEDFPEWYQQVVRAADLAENSEVRGCMVIKPWGYGLWESIQKQLDAKFKSTGHKNAYFPLLIPLSYLEKEAEHAEGFATECAVVTHHRLEAQKDENGKTRMVPAGELAEPYVIRPTSETIIGAAFSRWVESYRDLPLLINQWANVMRWEMRPRLFLRTAEFLWQEGHTAHETEAEARAETEQMHRVYEDFLRDYLALPCYAGEKTERERFPGAEQTLTVEVMVQDCKAIQAGTSHFLGQNFAKAADISFASREGGKEHAWTTSWGVSTRLVGTLIMAHADDDGMVMPPRVAPAHVVVLPVIPKDEHRAAIMEACTKLAVDMEELEFAGEPIRVELDSRDMGGGSKNWEWIKKGVPLRIEIGPRDLESGKVALSRRDKGAKEKEFLDRSIFLESMSDILNEMQEALLEKATALQKAHTVEISDKEKFTQFFSEQKEGGFAKVFWAGSNEDEEQIQKDLKVTARCILPDDSTEGVCFYTGEKTTQQVIFAKSY